MTLQNSDYTALIYCRVSDRKQLKGSDLESENIIEVFIEAHDTEQEGA